jgi:hypothetical protein
MQTCADDGASWGPCAGDVLPKPENCATPEDEDCDGKAPACDGSLLWAKSFGSPTGGYGASVATDSDGQTVVVGTFSGSIDFGGSSLTSAEYGSVFAAKLDASGGLLWAKQLGGSSQQQSVAVDAQGNVFVVGDFYGTMTFGAMTLDSGGNRNVFVAKLTPSGDVAWGTQITGTGSNGIGIGSVAVDSHGDVLLTGSFQGAVGLSGGTVSSAGGDDVFVVKLDPTGSLAWSKTFGDAADQRGVAVVTDAADDVIITGQFAGTVDFGGGSFTSGSEGNVFLAKLDQSGNHLWSKGFQSASIAHVTALAHDVESNVLLTGQFFGSVSFGGGPLVSQGDSDVFVVKLDAGGAYVWGERFGGSGSDIGVGIAADVAANILVAGNFSDVVDFGGSGCSGGGGCNGGTLSSAGLYDVFALKLTSTGATAWAKGFGDVLNQYGTVAVNAAGDAILTGSFYGTIDFGGGPLVSTGSSDVFVAKFSP